MIFQVPVKNAETNILKPVMVWFYYGAFAYGNGNPDFYGPDYLLEKDVIVVTFNYRVGPIGEILSSKYDLTKWKKSQYLSLTGYQKENEKIE